MDDKTIAFLKQTFRDFYYKNSKKISPPIRMEEREFGYMTFDKVMIRHLSFQTEGELRAFLVKEAPHSVYYSCAYYHEPNFAMDEKGWKGADLIFDIDADTIPTNCKEEHDRWVCKDCNFMGKGKRPEKCPKCGSNRIDEEKWVCPLCLDATKNETIKLIDFLLEDFGVSKEKIMVHFSGSRGYHVTVEGSALEKLDQLARNEISDYISGMGLTLESLGISKGTSYVDIYRSLPLVDEPGWRGRIARFFDKIEFEGYNEVRKDVRDKILYAYGKMGYKSFESFIKEIVNKLSVKIDVMVTTDIYRIFRLPNTLHGNTGMLKKKCDDIISFDPLIDAVVLGEEPVKLFINNAPRFTLKGNSFGPYNSEKVTLPLMASVYLMGKGLAKAINHG
ncbi:MAG: DNA primase small subunit domain-containing protein [Nitrososphaerales archaeon]